MTSNLIPLCHNILIDQIKLDFKVKTDSIVIQATAKCYGKTGIGKFNIQRVKDHISYIKFLILTVSYGILRLENWIRDGSSDECLNSGVNYL